MNEIKENDNFYELKKLYRLLNVVESSEILPFINAQIRTKTIRKAYFRLEHAIKDKINKLLNGDV